MVEYMQDVDSTLKDQASLMSLGDRNNRIQQLKEISSDTSMSRHPNFILVSFSSSLVV